MNAIRIRNLRRAGALVLLLLALLPFSAQRAAADYTDATLPAWAIGPFTRYAGNPILTPQGTGWESFNVFNPAVEVDHSTFHLL